MFRENIDTACVEKAVVAGWLWQHAHG